MTSSYPKLAMINHHFFRVLISRLQWQLELQQHNRTDVCHLMVQPIDFPMDIFKRISTYGSGYAGYVLVHQVVKVVIICIIGNQTHLLLANNTISIIEQNAQENGIVTFANYDGDDNQDGGEFCGSTAMALHNAHL